VEEPEPIFNPNTINSFDSFPFDEMGASAINDFTSDTYGIPNVTSVVNPENKKEAQTSTVDTGVIETSPQVPPSEKRPASTSTTQINIDAKLPKDQSPILIYPPGENTINFGPNEKPVAQSNQTVTNQISIFSPEEIKRRDEATKKETFEKIQSDILARRLGINTTTNNSRLEKMLGIKEGTIINSDNNIFSSATSNTTEKSSTSETSNTSSINENSSNSTISTIKESIERIEGFLKPKADVSSQNLINKYLSPAIKMASKNQEGSQISNNTGSSVSDVTLTKSSPKFEEKIPQSSEKIIERSNSALLEKNQSILAQNSQSSSSFNQSEITMTPEKVKDVSLTPVTESRPEPFQSVSVNLDALESRLSRLEYLLSNPLEVKIID
jgi:hypothetical protein